MAVAKRQGREKLAKMKQKKVRGPECGPQVKQTPLLAGPICTGRPRERETYKQKSQNQLSLSLLRAGALFSSCLWIDVPSCLEDGFSCYLLNKIEL